MWLKKPVVPNMFDSGRVEFWVSATNKLGIFLTPKNLLHGLFVYLFCKCQCYCIHIKFLNFAYVPVCI